MTTVALVADPPRPGLVLPRLPEHTPLSPDDAADCYAAMLADAAAAVDASGADLLVNYRPADALPESHAGGDAAAEVGTVVDPVAPDARYEVQVGETFSGRVGNTVAHLLDEEDVSSVVAVEPTVPFLERSHVDGAAMKLRRNDVVLAPGGDGRVALAGYGSPLEFTDAYAAPAVATLSARGRDAELAVGFAESLQCVETGRDLAAAVALLEARHAADAAVPERFAGFVDDRGLVAEPADEGLAVGVATDNA